MSAPLFHLALLAAPLLWFTAGLWRLWSRLNDPELAATWGAGDDWSTYRQTTERILEGHLLGGDAPLSVSTLTYPYALAGLALVFGREPANLYLGLHVLVGAACAVLAWLAYRLWGARAGWWTLGGAIAYTVLDLRVYTVVLLPENLALLVVALMFVALHRFFERPTVGTALLAGALLGVAVLTRFALLPFAGLVLAWVVGRRTRRWSR